jgi:DNA repair protein RecO (recombination protein O)
MRERVRTLREKALAIIAKQDKNKNMPRTAVYSAIVLRTRASGESNRDVWMLTAEEGILRATVFGGPKSKLRSHAAAFHSGTVWIYHDPVRDTRKLSDFDVLSWRPGLRELYERAMTADAIAETILVSHGGGGNWETALALAEPVLDALETADEECCARIFMYFLWRWAGFLGIQPNPEHCGGCGAVSADKPMLYSSADNSLYCPACIHGGAAEEHRATADFLQVDPGCRRWLLTASSLSPSALNRYTMDSKTFREVKMLTQTVLAGALGRRPASWDW